MKKSPAGKKKNKKPSPGQADVDQLGELPRSYGSDTIFLVAQEPHWLFSYWDIDISLHPGGKTFLKVYGPGDEVESEIEVPFETRNWYIPVKEAGACYAVEIGYHRGTQWHALARSVTVTTPQDRMSESNEFDYATIPLHISFQKLMDNIQTTMRQGETLIQALGRLQRDGKLLSFGTGFGLGPGSDERVVIEALLGHDFLEEVASLQLSSEELSSRVRQRLEERLHSQGGSEVLAGGQWGPAESSLFSALSSLTGASSWSSAALSSWAAAALTSWAAAAQSSWSGPGGASWMSGATSSWGAGALSSWIEAVKAAQASSGGSSWSAAALSSWMQAATSSWSGAALASWSEAALSSWSQAAISSWSHAETSSWGGSENIGSFGFAEREFFLHVNAEVIFYGGTHPQAKVTIDGKPVALSPDGSFRYHFVFPDGSYEIPITATSPDGVETRSAILKFERGTARSGDVGSTSQPPLPAPLGPKS